MQYVEKTNMENINNFFIYTKDRHSNNLIYCFSFNLKRFINIFKTKDMDKWRFYH